MSAIFDALPGIEVPVGAISKSLVRMWTETAAKGGVAPAADDVRATQVNFVLHFGFNTSADDAAQQFRTAVRFSQRYPSRVVVLCPLPPESPETELRAKVYGECFLGKSKGDTRCVEFVMLSYPMGARRFLEDQVSICLSTDLPLYYWAHRFSSSSRLADYQYLLRHAKRVMFDSSLVPADALSYRWPNAGAVRDLVHARLLPVRQSVGQFLAGFAPARLVEGLRQVTVKHAAEHGAEARVLLEWAQGRLAQCGAADGINFSRGTLGGAGAGTWELMFHYDGQTGSSFRWVGDLTHHHAHFEARYGGGPVTLTTALALLSPEAALAEAVFF